MDSLLEGSRHLYIPKGISWDAQVAHAHKLVNMGYVMYVHDHPYSLICTQAVEEATPNGGCIRITLTPGTTEHIVSHVSKTAIPRDDYTDPPAGGH